MVRLCERCGGEVPVGDDVHLRVRLVGTVQVSEVLCPACAGSETPARAPDRDRERILCAAIHFDDGQVREQQPCNIATGIVVCGRRHHNCFATVEFLESEGRTVRKAVNGVRQGFLTSADRFVTRREAAEIAVRAEQVAAAAVTKPDGTFAALYSEDLY